MIGLLCHCFPQIIGIALLGVGIWVSIDRTTVEFLLLFDDPLFRAVGFAAIAIGGLVTILGFLGCFGACHESHWMLWTVSKLCRCVSLGLWEERDLFFRAMGFASIAIRQER